MSNDLTSIGHTNNYIQIPSAAGSSEHSFELATQANANFSFTGAKTDITNAQAMTFSTKTFTGTINSGGANNQALTLNITGSATIQNFRDLNMASNAFPSAPAKNYSFTVKQAVNSSASGTSVSTAQMRLGNNNTYLELNNDTVTKLNGNLGVNIESATQPIKIRSNQSADGVQIDAYWGGSTSTVGHPYLHLTPQSSGTGDFVLSSGHGTVQSKGDLGSNRAGVQITPGFSSGWGILTNKINGTSNSLETKYSIITTDGSITSSKGTIKASDGNVWGNNFGFNDSKSWSAHGNTYNSQSLQQHLAWLYSLVNSAYNRADSAYNHADAVDSSIRSWANGRFALSGHTHSSYVTNTKFNNHTHPFVYTGKTFGEYGFAVTGISSGGSGTQTYTNVPS